MAIANGNGKEMATKADLASLGRGLREEMATKADLASLGKGLREEMASMEDRLRGEMASMEGRLRKDLASKEDLKGIERKLSIEIIRTHGRIDESERRTREEIRQGNSKIFKMLEEVIPRLADHKRTILVYDKIIGGHGERLQSHEKRLARLESAR